ncbi:DUF484 family protein [Agaribacterium haliotis]|uniref:DUF484 family protein n=1 Tax=Agaribacterium haliotis TaxID=2013869 RepID=UPI000BB532F4|nr:DUF484 family protein [Agaribacterium haliotis]
MSPDDIDANQVAAFLKQNPNFFEGREKLLSELRVPHNPGQAISLVEKQQAVLRERNTELRNRLSSLVNNARENDRLFSHTRQLVLSLLDSNNLSQAIDIVYSSFDSDFGVQYTEVILFDSPGLSRARNEKLSSAQEHIGKYLKARQTIGGGLGETERQYLFGERAQEIGSAALAVLAYGELYGVVAIGNRDANYYHSGMGTMFLSYISEVLSRSIRDFRARA